MQSLTAMFRPPHTHNSITADVLYRPMKDIKIGNSLPKAYFELQNCTDVRIYQDSHVTEV